MKLAIFILCLPFIFSPKYAISGYFPWGWQGWLQSVATITDAPSSGVLTGSVVFAQDTDALYYWDGSEWTELSGGGGGSGTVTSVSVVSANGFAGTVADATTTPAITMETSITGLLHGNGTAVAAETVSSPLNESSGTLSCLTASGSQAGCLSSTDWSTFNGKQASGNYITALTGDVSASGPGSAAATLATVNSDVGSYVCSDVTVNGKGLVTAAASGTSSDIIGLFSGCSGTDYLGADGACHTAAGTPGGSSSDVQYNSSGSFAGDSGLTYDGSGNITLSAKMSSASANLSGLTDSEAVFTDGSDNLVSNAITGTGSVVMSTSPTLVTPALGTPASGVATNLTGLPLTTGVTGILPIANGGTDSTSLPADSVLIGNGTGALSSTAVAAGTAGNVLTDNGTTWVSAGPPSAESSSKNLLGLGLAVSVSGDGVTVALKQSDGSTDPSAGTPVYIGIRSSTSDSGAYNQESVTSALSVTAPHLATLGQASGVSEQTDIFAQDDSGTIQLCLATAGYFDEGTVYTSNTIGTGSTSRATLYCTAGVSGALRLIGRFTSTQTTAGVWLASPTEVSVSPFQYASITSAGPGQYHTEYVQFGGSSNASACSSTPCTIYSQSGTWVSSVTRSGAGKYVINVTSGEFSDTPICVATADGDLGGFISGVFSPASSTSTAINVGTLSTSTYVDGSLSVICMGPH